MIDNNKIVIGISCFFAFYIELFLEAREYYFTGEYSALLNNQISLDVLLRLCLLFVLCLMLMGVFVRFSKKFYALGRHRFLAGTILVAFCTYFELSGSSLGVWAGYLQHNISMVSDLMDIGTVWGIPRAIRSDEWAVFTPFNLSQEFNDYKSVTEIIRGVNTDVTTTYGLACYALVTLFRPFLIGYMIFGSAKGLAFFWASRTVFLFLVSYEFGKMLTKKHVHLSWAYAIAITFSQTIQWWYSINGLLEMFLFGQLAIVLWDWLIHTDNRWKRVVISLGMIECAGGFIFTLYPPQEILLGYIFAVLFIIFCLMHWDEIRKKDFFVFVFSLILFLFISICIIYGSRDVFFTLMHTEYPGNRIETGGDEDVRTLFYWIISLFTPVDEDRISAISNASDAASFYSLFPMGLMLSVYGMIKKKKADALSLGIIILEVIFLLFSFVGFSEKMAKLTLLSYSLTVRVVIIVGFLELLLLFRAISLQENTALKSKMSYVKCGCALVFSFFAAYLIHDAGSTSCHVIWMLAILTSSVVVSVIRDKKKFAYIFSIIVVLSGVHVNPVQVGIDVIEDDVLVETIGEIVKEDQDATWVVLDSGYPILNLPIMAGAKTVNCTNVYPNLELWSSFDADREYSCAYNRYAHIIIQMTEEEQEKFVVLGKDLIVVNLTEEQVKSIGATYVLSSKQYENDFEKIAEVEEYYIYKIN